MKEKNVPEKLWFECLWVLRASEELSLFFEGAVERKSVEKICENLAREVGSRLLRILGEKKCGGKLEESFFLLQTYSSLNRGTRAKERKKRILNVSKLLISRVIKSGDSLIGV